ncbi:MAG: PDC sensor domain-containing protein, partial [Gammaproteobacteria bacterium]|nr:PDC sensor domain-containing protein [Gammaproteobacteria bacterium]
MKLSILHKVVVLATLLVVITTGTVTIAYYFSGTSLLVQRELENLTQRISREGELLQLHIKEMEQDAVIATSLTSVKLALVGDKKTRNENRRQVEIYLKELLHENKNYFQVRLIDIYGNEIVRVDRTGGELIVMPESSLQNKAKRSYYKETLKLASEEIYLSEINLNREYGKVVEPHRPTIRAATPVIIKESGQMVGMVVINMDIGNEFEKIKMNYQNDAKSLYITNDKGGYLAHPDNDRVYGFDLGKQYRVQEEFPQLAKLFLPENKDVSIVLLPDQTLSSKVVAFTK